MTSTLKKILIHTFFIPSAVFASIDCTITKPCIQKSMGSPYRGGYIWSGALEFNGRSFNPINSNTGEYDTKSPALYFSQTAPGKISILNPLTFEEEIIGTITTSEVGVFQFRWDPVVKITLSPQSQIFEKSQCVNGAFGPYIRKFRELRKLIQIKGHSLSSILGSSSIEEFGRTTVDSCHVI